jgi:hypothetical protein
VIRHNFLRPSPQAKLSACDEAALLVSTDIYPDSGAVYSFGRILLSSKSFYSRVFSMGQMQQPSCSVRLHVGRSVVVSRHARRVLIVASLVVLDTVSQWGFERY